MIFNGNHIKNNLSTFLLLYIFFVGFSYYVLSVFICSINMFHVCIYVYINRKIEQKPNPLFIFSHSFQNLALNFFSIGDACPARLFSAVDNIFCLFHWHIENVAPLKQYGLIYWVLLVYIKLKFWSKNMLWFRQFKAKICFDL